MRNFIYLILMCLVAALATDLFLIYEYSQEDIPYNFWTILCVLSGINVAVSLFVAAFAAIVIALRK